MENRKGVEEEVNSCDTNQDPEFGPREKEDWLVEVEQEFKKCDDNQDQQPGALETNVDGTAWVKEEVENCDPNQDQKPAGPCEKNNDGPVRVKPGDYHKELLRQNEALDPRQFPEVIELVEQPILTSCSSNSSEENSSNHVHISLDLFNDPWIRLTAKCCLPRNFFGKFNYASRMMGPRGAYFKALVAETGTEMFFRGKGSMNDTMKEQLLRDGGDPKYSDLNEEAHVLITVYAPTSEVYSKLGYATSCFKRHVLRRDCDALPPWIAKVIKKGEGPSRYNKSQSSKDECSRYTRGRDPTLPLREVFNIENEAPVPVRSHYRSTEVNLTEQCGAFGKTVIQLVGSAGSNNYRLLRTASQEYRSATTVRYHPY